MDNALSEKLKLLRKLGYLNSNGEISEKSILSYTTKLIDKIEAELIGIYDYGFYKSKEYGEDEIFFNKYYGYSDSFREINPKKSIRSFLKRKKFIVDKKLEKKGGEYFLIIDISGSMHGKKLLDAKKAAIGLAYKILEDNNILNVILFNDKIVKSIRNVNKIEILAKEIIPIRAIGGTDIALALNSIEPFDQKAKAHAILITDSMPTVGEDPVYRTIKAAETLRDRGISLSIVGINLSKDGEKLAKRIVNITNGKLYIIKETKNLVAILLKDYFYSKDSTSY